MAKVVSFLNYKGGVGKTTTTYHVGCSLAEHHGKRVLLIDTDPQTNLTFLCKEPRAWEHFKRTRGTIASLYKRYQDNSQQALDTKHFIWQMPVGTSYRTIRGLDLIPCDLELLGEDLGGGVISGVYPTWEQLRRQASAYLRERRFLQRVIKEVEDKYDYVLIDCPPNLYLMTQNALFASDWYVIPAIPDRLSTIGLNILIRKVGMIGDQIQRAQGLVRDSNPTGAFASLGGIVFVKVRIGGSMITNMHENVMNAIKGDLGASYTFAHWTTELIGYSDAAEVSLPIWQTNTQNAKRAADKNEYQDITKEFLRRFP